MNLERIDTVLNGASETNNYNQIVENLSFEERQYIFENIGSFDGPLNENIITNLFTDEEASMLLETSDGLSDTQKLILNLNMDGTSNQTPNVSSNVSTAKVASGNVSMTEENQKALLNVLNSIVDETGISDPEQLADIMYSMPENGVPRYVLVFYANKFKKNGELHTSNEAPSAPSTVDAPLSEEASNSETPVVDDTSLKDNLEGMLNSVNDVSNSELNQGENFNGSSNMNRIDTESLLNCQRQIDIAVSNLEELENELNGINNKIPSIQGNIETAKNNISDVFSSSTNLSYTIGRVTLEYLTENGTDEEWNKYVEYMKSNPKVSEASEYKYVWLGGKWVKLPTEEERLALQQKVEEEGDTNGQPLEGNSGTQQEELSWFDKWARFNMLNNQLQYDNQQNAFATLGHMGLLFGEGTAKGVENYADAISMISAKLENTPEDRLFLFEDIMSLGGVWNNTSSTDDMLAFNSKPIISYKDMQEATTNLAIYCGLEDEVFQNFFKVRTEEEKRIFSETVITSGPAEGMTYGDVESVFLHTLYHNGYDLGNTNTSPLEVLKLYPMEAYKVEKLLTTPVTFSPETFKKVAKNNPKSLPMLIAAQGTTMASKYGLTDEEVHLMFHSSNPETMMRKITNEESPFFDMTYGEAGNYIAAHNYNGDISLGRRTAGTTTRSGASMIRPEDEDNLRLDLEAIARDNVGVWFDENVYNKPLPWNYNQTVGEYLNEHSSASKDNIIGQVSYGLGVMTPNILLNAAGTSLGMPGIGTAAIFLNSYGGNAESDLNLIKNENPELWQTDIGEVYNRANNTALMQAGLETILETGFNSLIGGFKVKGAKVRGLDDLVEKVSNIIPAPIKNLGLGTEWSKTIKLYGGIFGEEGEDITSFLINPLIIKFNLLPEMRIEEAYKIFASGEEFWNTVIVTGISSGVMQGLSINNYDSETYRDAKIVHDAQPLEVRMMLNDADIVALQTYKQKGFNGLVDLLRTKMGDLKGAVQQMEIKVKSEPIINQYMKELDTAIEAFESDDAWTRKMIVPELNEFLRNNYYAAQQIIENIINSSSYKKEKLSTIVPQFNAEIISKLAIKFPEISEFISVNDFSVDKLKYIPNEGNPNGMMLIELLTKNNSDLFLEVPGNHLLDDIDIVRLYLDNGQIDLIKYLKSEILHAIPKNNNPNSLSLMDLMTSKYESQLREIMFTNVEDEELLKKLAMIGNKRAITIASGKGILLELNDNGRRILELAFESNSDLKNLIIPGSTRNPAIAEICIKYGNFEFLPYASKEVLGFIPEGLSKTLLQLASEKNFSFLIEKNIEFNDFIKLFKIKDSRMFNVDILELGMDRIIEMAYYPEIQKKIISLYENQPENFKLLKKTLHTLYKSEISDKIIYQNLMQNMLEYFEKLPVPIVNSNFMELSESVVEQLSYILLAVSNDPGLTYLSDSLVHITSEDDVKKLYKTVAEKMQNDFFQAKSDDEKKYIFLQAKLGISKDRAQYIVDTFKNLSEITDNQEILSFYNLIKNVLNNNFDFTLDDSSDFLLTAENLPVISLYEQFLKNIYSAHVRSGAFKVSDIAPIDHVSYSTDDGVETLIPMYEYLGDGYMVAHVVNAYRSNNVSTNYRENYYASTPAHEGKHGLSTSMISYSVDPVYKTNVIYGFNDWTDRALFAMKHEDLQSSVPSYVIKMFEKPEFNTSDYILNNTKNRWNPSVPLNHNELLFERSDMTPSYVIIYDSMTEEVKNNSVKAAYDWGIPIVIVHK